MSYPTTLKLFKAWARAMEEGSTVGKPNYGKTVGQARKTKPRKRPGRKRRRRRLKRVKEMKNG